MKNKIGIIVPLKSNMLVKRVRDLDRFLWSWHQYTQGYSDVILRISDEEKNFYLDNMMYPTSDPRDRMIILSGKQGTVTEILNEAAINIADDYDIVAFMNDDFVIGTHGWEEEIIKWQEENRGICWGNDLLQGGNLTTHFFMDSSIVKALGYVAPPTMEHFYIDNYWMNIGFLIGKLKYFPDLIFEHRHPSNGKNTSDSVYEEGNASMNRDRLALDAFRAEGLEIRDAEKIIEYQKKTL